MELNIVDNATCTFCGCVCDDIRLHSDGNRIHKAERACVLGKAWFLNHTGDKKYPAAIVEGRETTVDEAIQVAADLLHEADMPLVYGMHQCQGALSPEIPSLSPEISLGLELQRHWGKATIYGDEFRTTT
jgi:formylmethanofuran dehydrogenase subunit B